MVSQSGVETASAVQAIVPVPVLETLKDAVPALLLTV
jgi:hypothetical protein